MDSVIMTDNLATIDESEIDRVIGAFVRLGEAAVHPGLASAARPTQNDEPLRQPR